MADIKEINYDQIINGASKIANFANEMQNSVKEAFQKIETMSNDWFGNSYDKYIDFVNALIPQLNELFQKTVCDIPHELVAKAKSYASANQTSCGTSFNEQIALILKDLPRTNKGNSLRFKSSEVSLHQSSIKSKLDQADSNLKEALNVCRALESDWQSVSGEKNIEELINAFRTIESAVLQFGTTLNNIIEAQKGTVDRLESMAELAEAASELPGKTIDGIVDAGTNLKNEIAERANDIWTNWTGKN